jgi:hypothetical protein
VTSKSPRRALLALLVIGGLAAAVSLQIVRDRRYPDVASPVQELYFTSGDAVGRMALSYKALLADVYWIRAVQYFGSTRLAAKDRAAARPAVSYDLLYPLLDVATSLDPAFNIAYRFGATFLSEAYPNGPGKPDLAVKLLDKGSAANPEKWQYVYDKAFVYFWALRDYNKASYWFSKASQMSGSPEWMPGLAAFMVTQAGDRQSARFLWQQIVETAEHEYMRKNAEVHLVALDLLDAMDELDRRLDRYAQAAGARATSWTPLIQHGLLRKTPTDPDGVAFVIDPSSGRARLPKESKFYSLTSDAEPPPVATERPPAS